jgi:hypothetical protein
MATPEPDVARRTQTQPPLGLGEDSETQRSTGFAGEQPPVVPLRRRLVEQLKDYPQLRERVEGFMLAQEWRKLAVEMQSHLDHDEKVVERAFWRDLWELLTRDPLRAAFPRGLAEQDEIRDHLTCFQGRLEKAREAARPAGSPYQDPERKQIAAEVLNYVDSMWNAADMLAARCRDDTKELLVSLNSCVEEIFKNLEEAHEAAAPTERAVPTATILDRPDADREARLGSPSRHHEHDGVESVNAAGNQAILPDVEAHWLGPRTKER